MQVILQPQARWTLTTILLSLIIDRVIGKLIRGAGGQRSRNGFGRKLIEMYVKEGIVAGLFCGGRRRLVVVRIQDAVFPIPVLKPLQHRTNYRNLFL